MNKHLYRVVFNQARGLLMVVAENAASHRSVSSPASGRGHLMCRLAAALSPAGFAVLLALGAVTPVHAAIVADGSAPGSQQPTIVGSANGTPQVNIQAPSAGGVSHNKYSQFNVDQKGAILNNSHANTATQLGGMITGNPSLARGEAKVILNEVNSRDPSSLNGYIEVAGRKADVIIANPSGISCSGCGFINANRSTLTTGTPQMKNGNLTGFTVKGGEVAIEGAGLDGSRQNYTDIIARSVKINGQITAKNLAITTGRNQVDATNENISALEDDGSDKPQMALDVSSIGGMYAGKIRLVGTERGVGVRNGGQIGASAGSVTISADGSIGNSGQVRSSEEVAISGRDVSNSGVLVAGSNLTVQGDNVSNTASSVLAAGVDAQGNQTQSGNLTLKADGTLSAHGRNQAGAALQASAQRVDLSGSRTSAGSVNVDAGSGTLSTADAQLVSADTTTLKSAAHNNQRGQIVAQGDISGNSTTLDNSDGGLIQSGGNIKVRTGTLDNRNSGSKGGVIAQKDLHIDGDAFDNQSGVALAGGAADYTGKTLSNQNGQLVAQSALTLDLLNGGSNQQGLLQGDGVVLDSHDSAFSNQDGTLYSLDTLTFNGGNLTNSGGSLGAKGDVTLTSTALDNSQNGRIIAGGSSEITSANVNNSAGAIQAVGDLLLASANGTINNIAGLIRSGRQAILRADILQNNQTQGTDQGIEAQDLRLTSNRFENQSGSVLAGSALTVSNSGTLDNARGQITAGKTLTASGDRLALTNTGGALKAGEQFSLTADAIGGDGQLLSLGNMQLTSQQDFTNSGTLIANGDVSFTTPGSIANSGQLLAGGALTIRGANLVNSQNGEINALQNTVTVDGSLSNAGLIDGGQTHINANTVNNSGSGRIYGDNIALQAVTFNNLAENGVAPVLAGRERVDIGVSTLNNVGHALIYSAGDMAIGRSLDANFRATGRADAINNHSATLESAGNMQLDSAQLNNINDDFATQLVTVGEEDILEYGFRGQRYSPNDYTIYTYQDEVTILCIEGVICHSTDGDDWIKYSYHRTTQETRVTRSDPGKILSGGSLTVNADTLLNDKSQVVAGSTLLINAASVNNVEVDGERHVTDQGWATHYYRIQKKHSDDQGKDGYAYTPPTVIQSIRLKPSELTDHGAVAGSGFTPGALQTQHSDAQPGADTGSVTPLNASQLQPGQRYEVSQSGDLVVRVSAPDTRLPDNSLFKTNPAPNAQYLVETDPRFTNNKQWLGSDYMMQQIASDPNKVQKRLGDGFYEQRLVREQIIGMTGQRYLSGYSSDEEQYKALMNNGVSFARQYDLTLGVALTPEQMKLMTSDMVWLVSREVTMPDGSVQQVLVPQVYARVQSGDIDGSGALLAGKNLGMGLSGGLLNQGTIAATDRLVVNADNITNQVGTMQGADVSLAARTDINNLGGMMQGENTLLVSAGRDINLISSTRSAEQGSFARSNIDSVSGTYVQGDDGKLVLQAGRDLTLTAAQVSNSGENGQTQLSAGRDLTLNTVTIGSRDDLLFNENDWSKESSSRQTGSEVTGKGDITLLAGHDASLTAATVSAGEALRVQAGNNITLNHGVDTTDVDQYLKVNSSGFLSKKTREKQLTTHSEEVNGTLLSGDSVQMGAGNDIRVTGSSVAGTHDVLLDAGNDLIVEDAVTRQRDFSMFNETKSGLSGTGGIGVSYGTQSTKTTDEGVSSLSSGSTLGSSEGSLTLQAGNQLSVKGSDLIAQQDMLLSGKEVSILAAQEQSSQTHTVEQKTSGLTLALSGTAGSAVNSAVQQSRAAHDQDDSRLAALQATKAALTGYQAGQAVRLDEAKGASDAANNDTVGISLSYGSQSSKSTQHSEQSTSQGSSLSAGNNLNVVARGSGEPGSDGDITVVGSQLKAGGDVSLSANRDVNLLSGENTSSLTGSNESKGGSVGVGIGAGSGGWGINVSASVNKGHGSESGNGTTWSETTVDAGQQVNIVSGRDTTLTGAQVSGNRIVADVGRDLTLTSQQDTDTYDSKQQNASAGGSFNFGSMTGSASVNMSRDKMHSNYQSVQEQTGLFAGSGGFDLTVGNHTQLNGAVIGSTAGADKNRLDTGTLGFSDIQNQADFKTEHQSAGFSTGGAIGGQFAGNMANTLLTGGNTSGHDEGTTRSAVSDGTIVVRNGADQRQDVNDLSRDVEHANGSIGQIFDKEKEQKRLEQAQMIGEIGSQVADIARAEGDIAATKAANEKMKDVTPEQLLAAKKELMEANPGKTPTDKEISGQAYTTLYKEALANTGLGTGGKFQQVIQAATAAVQGLAGGDIAKAIAGGSAPYLAEVIHKMTTDANGNVNKPANLMAHAVVNAALAAAQGNNVLVGAGGAATAEMVGMIATSAYGKPVSELSETEKQTVSALATLAAGLSGGLIGDSSADMVTAAQVGKTTVENNFLGKTSSDKLFAAIEKIKAGDKSLATANELIKTENADQRSEVLLDKFRHDPSSLSESEQIELNAYVRVYASEMEAVYGPDEAKQRVQALFAYTGSAYKRNPDTEVLNQAEGIVNTWGYHKSNASIGDAPLIMAGSVLGLTIKGMAANAAIGVGVNAGVQLAGKDPFSYVDAIMAGTTAALTTGKGIIVSTPINMGGAAVGSSIKGEDPTNSVIGAGLGSVAGGIGGKAVDVLSPISNQVTKDVVGAVTGSAASELTGTAVKNELDERDKK